MLVQTICGTKGEVLAWIYKEGKEYSVIDGSGRSIGFATEGSGTYDETGKLVSWDCAPALLVRGK